MVAFGPESVTGLALVSGLAAAGADPPSRVGGLRVRETRRDDRRWTRGQLVEELREVGIRIGQTDVARSEKLPGDKGHDPRSITVEDWLALAFVLDVLPLALLLPEDPEQLAIVPEGVRPLTRNDSKSPTPAGSRQASAQDVQRAAAAGA